ncbi:Large cysteine-rich periplasmic protein OmcB precursor [Polystyrenella longa]|uniref:Large cysteine-rich periplasmic protein OmcB n=1 Tax=Polystyrenella longa TaxID=2528007 RepID=A0A518CQI4_9PLAN|nr:DUF11 domain-containing protein [Polystyrenella longa]QDU81488.1 Large cysteine-rich periplasmic protein OmcB precursor [Polystyrenella longa]
MRNGLMILTTLLLLMGGWGLLSAQSTSLDEFPDHLVPSDLDNKFFLDEVGDAALESERPGKDLRLPSSSQEKMLGVSGRNLGAGKFSGFESEFERQPVLSAQSDSGFDRSSMKTQSRQSQSFDSDTFAGPSIGVNVESSFSRSSSNRKTAFSGFGDEPKSMISQAGFEEQASPGGSMIQQVNSQEQNPFLKKAQQDNTKKVSATAPVKPEASAAELSFPSFPDFELDAKEDAEELEEADETSVTEFQIQPEVKTSAPSPSTSMLNLVPQSEDTETFDQVPSSFSAPGLTGASFAPAPWSKLTIKGPITPSVATRWINKGVLNVGQPAECELQVRNISATSVHNFLIDTVLPPHVELVSVQPETPMTNGQLSWEIDHLKGDEELSFKIKFIPRQRGPLMAEAHVRFSAMTAAAFHVEEPMLKLALEGPERVMVGEAATQIITVANPGTGVAQNVMIHAEVPDGLEHAQGKKVALPVGSLNPGEKRRVRLPLVCVAGGTQKLQISAVAESGLTEVATTSVDVIAPELALLAEGPRLRYVGRTATYRLTVNNIGSAESSNVRLLHRVPTGFNFVQADKGGKFNETTRVVQWFVGRLDQGQTTVVQVQLEATELGKGVQQFAAVSDQATRTEAVVETAVDGTPSLALEILDLDDPVEIGRETAYEIRVRNVGSKAAQQVELNCELPGGVAFKSARGPSAHKEANGVVLFKPLATLPAGETAIFRVHVVGSLAGKHNMSVELKSLDDDEPLVYQEQTQFYQD